MFVIFPRDTGYFGSSGQAFMVNSGAPTSTGCSCTSPVLGWRSIHGRDSSSYGRFAWIVDPDGNRVELWEPPASG